LRTWEISTEAVTCGVMGKTTALNLIKIRRFEGKMKPLSFRFKIILTLIVVIVTISFFSFLTFSKYLGDRIYRCTEENVISMLSLLKDHYLFTVSQSGGKMIYSFLQELEKNQNVLNAFLLNSEGKVVYPPKIVPFTEDSLNADELLLSEKPITFKSFKTGRSQFLRYSIQVENSPECYQCHSPSEKNLGYIVIDYSMQKADENIAFTHKFGRIFTFSLLIVIFFSMAFMHYKFVRKSLSSFKDSIGKIERGNLNERVKIPESDELGALAKSFNEMVEKLLQAQKELSSYHQRELRNAQKLATVGEMAASLAHEIKNPLTGIANAIEIIVQEMGEGERKPVLEEIQRQAKRVNKAINDLLQYSRPVRVYLEPGDINEIINSVVFFLKNQVQDKEIKFILNLQEGIPKFKFDHVQIENALFNLGMNAIQSITNKGTIIFTTVYNPKINMVWIKIVDTGAGIPEDKLAQIFTPFFTTRHQGTGLGLAITKDIIERHQGEILVESEIRGGSIFTISLPINLNSKNLREKQTIRYEKLESPGY
jgi:signal transduction histidine kinase